MSRTAVLLLVDKIDAQAAGAERFVAALAVALPADRFAVHVCTTREGTGPLVDAFAPAGVAHLDLGRTRRWDLRAMLRLARYLRTQRIEVLHAHKYGSNVWGAVVGRLAGVPVIVAHEHTWSYVGQPLRRLIDRRLIARLADAFVAVSDADRGRMISIERVPPDKIVVIPAGYVPRAAAPAADLRAELGLTPATRLVGAVAVFRVQKALDVLIDAYALLARDDVHLVLAGAGACEAALREQVAGLGLARRVHFVGFRQDVDSVWAALDVAVLSSDYEGLPAAALEAIANGTPLVATRVGGLPELIDHERSGLLVPARDPAALAAAIDRVLADPVWGAELAAAARPRLAGHGIEPLTERVGRLYDELLAERRSNESRGSAHRR